ncbi:hypothetical protein Lalb_Chr14g0369491 [Lupinus albus]|nr:hypothetical protein Lalb_Chr14g0369491 [Lupinus albus]
MFSFLSHFFIFFHYPLSTFIFYKLGLQLPSFLPLLFFSLPLPPHYIHIFSYSIPILPFIFRFQHTPFLAFKIFGGFASKPLLIFSLLQKYISKAHIILILLHAEKSKYSCLNFMSPVLSEILRSGFMINSSLRRRTHLVQSFSVVFLYWFYVFS